MTIIRLLIKTCNPSQLTFWPSNAVTPSPHSFAVLKKSLGDTLGMFRGTVAAFKTFKSKNNSSGIHGNLRAIAL